jgi:HlyD family secretion protein
MKNKKKLWIVLSVIGLIILLSFVFKGGKKDIEVNTDVVGRKNITEIVSVTGKIQPETEVKISADVSGEIIAMGVKEGDSVTRGQLLLRINPELYESTVSQLEANLNNAKASLAGSEAQLIRAKANYKQQQLNLDRQKKLYSQGVISIQELESFTTQFEVSQADYEATQKQTLATRYNVQSVAARLEEGKRNLGRTSIYAPESGIVTNLKSEKGERVVGTAQMAGTEIMRISNLNVMEVQVTVNENDIVRIHLGDSADVKIDAYDDRLFAGVVTEIANSAVFNQTQNLNDQVTNFIVKVRLLRSSYSDLLNSGKFPFLPGMTASVDIKTDHKSNVVAVPIASVITRDPFENGTGFDSEESKKLSNKEGKASKSIDTSKESAQKSPKSVDGSLATNRVKTWVFILENGKAKAVEVTTGIQNLDYFEILSGVKEGQTIITGPSMVIAKTLNHDDPVQVQKLK